MIDGRIDAVGIVIPAHDEEELLPECLAAIEQARIPIPTRLVVVLDACTDRSAEIAGVSGISVTHRTVGRARAAGVNAVLRHFAGVPRRRLWLAMTDADSRVPGHWLREQLRLARDFVAVAGTVAVDEWGAYPDARIESYEQFYANAEHVHGANLGIRADAYLAAGGFRPLATSEDVALFTALESGGWPVTRTRAIPVLTSSRLTARAPDGFASFLRDWAA